MAAQPGGSALPDATAVPLADGRADDYSKEVCQTSGSAGIYGMILCKTEKFPGCSTACKAIVFRQNEAGYVRFLGGSGRWRAHLPHFGGRRKKAPCKSHPHRQKHGHYDEYRIRPCSQNLRFFDIIKPSGYREAAAWL